MDEFSPFPILDFLAISFDPYSEVHAANVSRHAVELARIAGLDPHEIERIEIAARYHDIGKIFVPYFIRRLPGLYVPIERVIMQKHCEMGAQFLQLFNFDPEVIAIVLDHQEHYDGTGYPMGLHGENIPIGARIIHIVDAYDALINNRGYRQASSPKRALEKMQAEYQKFDPKLLRLFSDLVRASWTQPKSL